MKNKFFVGILILLWIGVILFVAYRMMQQPSSPAVTTTPATSNQ